MNHSKQFKKLVALLLFSCFCFIGDAQNNVLLSQVVTGTNDITEGPVDILLDGGNRYTLYYLDKDFITQGNRGIGLAKQDIATGTFTYNKNFQCANIDIAPVKLMMSNGILYCLAQILTKPPLYPPTGPVLMTIDPLTGLATNSYFFPTSVPTDFRSRAADMTASVFGDYIYILGYTQHRATGYLNDSYTPNKIFILKFSTLTSTSEYKEFYDPSNNLYFNPFQLEYNSDNWHTVVGTVYDNTSQQKLGLYLDKYTNLGTPGNTEFSFDIDGKEINYTAYTNTDGFLFLYGQLKTGYYFGELGETEIYFDSPFFMTHDFGNSGPLNGKVVETFHINNGALISHNKHTFDPVGTGGAYYNRCGTGLFFFYYNQDWTQQNAAYGVGRFEGYYEGYANNAYQLHTNAYRLKGVVQGVALDYAYQYFIRAPVSSMATTDNTCMASSYEAAVLRDEGNLHQDWFYTINNNVGNCSIDVPQTQDQGIVNTHDLNLTETSYTNFTSSPITIIESDFAISSNYLCDDPYGRTIPTRDGENPFRINYSYPPSPADNPNDPTEGSRTINSNNLTVYPNPFTNNFTVSAKKQIKSIAVYSADGSLVKKIEQSTQTISKENIIKGAYSIKVTMLENLSKGAYGIKVVYTDNSSDTKVIIKD
jgi:hypothetical protein